MVSTATLPAGMVQLVVRPVETVEVTGTTAFGLSGLLLALPEAVRSWRVPVEATLNGKLKVND